MPFWPPCLPALARAKEKADTRACINNQQIGSTLMTQHLSRMPAREPAIPVLEDWIYWNAGECGLRHSPALINVDRQYTAGFNPNLLRCPSDKDVLKRLD